MKISEIITNEPEDKALAGLDVQKASLKLRQVQKRNLPKPPKPAQPSRPTGSKSPLAPGSLALKTPALVAEPYEF